MNYPQNRVAGSYVGDENAHRQNVVKLVERELLSLHLLVNAVIMLGPALNPARNIFLMESLLQHCLSLRDNFLHFGQTFLDATGYLRVNVGLQIFERQIFQFALEVIYTQPVSEGGVNLHSLTSNTFTFVRAHEVQRPHVVQSVG